MFYVSFCTANAISYHVATNYAQRIKTLARVSPNFFFASNPYLPKSLPTSVFLTPKQILLNGNNICIMLAPQPLIFPPFSLHAASVLINTTFSFCFTCWLFSSGFREAKVLLLPLQQPVENKTRSQFAF
jgi:hypothetical protein